MELLKQTQKAALQGQAKWDTIKWKLAASQWSSSTPTAMVPSLIRSVSEEGPGTAVGSGPLECRCPVNSYKSNKSKDLGSKIKDCIPCCACHWFHESTIASWTLPCAFIPLYEKVLNWFWNTYFHVLHFCNTWRSSVHCGGSSATASPKPMYLVEHIFLFTVQRSDIYAWNR